MAQYVFGNLEQIFFNFKANVVQSQINVLLNTNLTVVGGFKITLWNQAIHLTD